jgi:hypothetical protein
MSLAGTARQGGDAVRARCFLDSRLARAFG